jgi:hypothetical protein
MSALQRVVSLSGWGIACTPHVDVEFSLLISRQGEIGADERHFSCLGV